MLRSEPQGNILTPMFLPSWTFLPSVSVSSHLSAMPSLPRLLFSYSFSHCIPQLATVSFHLLPLPPNPPWTCISPSLCGNTGQIVHLRAVRRMWVCFAPPLDFNQDYAVSMEGREVKFEAFKHVFWKWAQSMGGLTSVVVFKGNGSIKRVGVWQSLALTT